MENNFIPFSVEEMVNVKLRSFQIDPVFFQKHPDFLSRNNSVAKVTDHPQEGLPKSAKRYLKIKRLPGFHQLEANFYPYFKAAKYIKYPNLQKTLRKDYDLAEAKHKQFTNDLSSLRALFKSESPIKVSRLPSFFSMTNTHKTESPSKFSSTTVKHSNKYAEKYHTSPMERSKTMKLKAKIFTPEPKVNKNKSVKPNYKKIIEI
jgi:hypothetical protein